MTKTKGIKYSKLLLLCLKIYWYFFFGVRWPQGVLTPRLFPTPRYLALVPGSNRSTHLQPTLNFPPRDPRLPISEIRTSVNYAADELAQALRSGCGLPVGTPNVKCRMSSSIPNLQRKLRIEKSSRRAGSGLWARAVDHRISSSTYCSPDEVIS